MRFADGRSAGLRKTEMPDLALLNQFFNCSRHIFNRHGGVNPVLIKELNAVSVQPFQRLLNYLADMLRFAVEANGAIDGKAEFGSDGNVVAKGCQRFANQLLTCVGANTSAVSKKVTPIS